MVRRKSPKPMTHLVRNRPQWHIPWKSMYRSRNRGFHGKIMYKGWIFHCHVWLYRSVNRPAHRQAARKCGVRSLRSLRWKCWWGNGWAVSDADHFYFLKICSGLVSGLGGPMGTHGDPHLGRKLKRQHPKLAILRWIIIQQIGLGHPSLRRAHFMPMINCWWKGRLKGKSILKGIILHSWRGLPQKDPKTIGGRPSKNHQFSVGLLIPSNSLRKTASRRGLKATVAEFEECGL